MLFGREVLFTRVSGYTVHPLTEIVGSVHMLYLLRGGRLPKYGWTARFYKPLQLNSFPRPNPNFYVKEVWTAIWLQMGRLRTQDFFLELFWVVTCCAGKRSLVLCCTMPVNVNGTLCGFKPPCRRHPQSVPIRPWEPSHSCQKEKRHRGPSGPGPPKNLTSVSQSQT